MFYAYLPHLWLIWMKFGVKRSVSDDVELRWVLWKSAWGRPCREAVQCRSATSRSTWSTWILFQGRLIFWAFGSWTFDLTTVLHYCCWWGQLESAVCGDAAVHVVTVRKWHFIGQQFRTSERRNINPVRPTTLYVPPGLTFKIFYVLPTQCIYVFCVDLRTNSDYFPVQH